MANEKAIFRRNGDKIDYVCTAAVACGDVIKLPGGLVGVAEVGGVENELIALTVNGVFEFMTDEAVIEQGALVYLKSDGKATATADSNTLIGTAWNKAEAGSGTTVLVKINTGSAAGAAGPQGPKGDTGEQGPAGAKGDTGAAGKDGLSVKSMVVNVSGTTISGEATLSDDKTKAAITGTYTAG